MFVNLVDWSKNVGKLVEGSCEEDTFQYSLKKNTGRNWSKRSNNLRAGLDLTIHTVQE